MKTHDRHSELGFAGVEIEDLHVKDDEISLNRYDENTGGLLDLQNVRAGSTLKTRGVYEPVQKSDAQPGQTGNVVRKLVSTNEQRRRSQSYSLHRSSHMRLVRGSSNYCRCTPDTSLFTRI